ncbi:MAG: DUF3365 domain-containing protein [Nitrospirota bacterium]|jgi:general secretion pathway protein A|nr:DUF3365 domain-containing protein [Nitrospirota bacterium]
MTCVAKKILMIMIAGGLGLAGPSCVEAGVTPYQAEETARLIAMLLSTGRVVIDRHQSLIDDPSKGAKGFTPEVFERQVVNEFRSRTGVDLTKPASDHLPPSTTNLLRALLDASKDVVAEAQPVINQQGVGYKHFIPATFGSQVAERFSARSGIQLKQTTLEPRNPKNAPDPYEKAVLRRLLTQPSQSVTISEVQTGNNMLRVLTPIYYTRDCLACHGGPAGQLDISGYRKEGAEEGDLAGAISVSIPLNAVK